LRLAVNFNSLHPMTLLLLPRNIDLIRMTGNHHSAQLFLTIELSKVKVKEVESLARAVALYLGLENCW